MPANGQVNFDGLTIDAAEEETCKDHNLVFRSEKSRTKVYVFDGN